MHQHRSARPDSGSPDRLSPWEGPRQRHLVSLWNEYLSEGGLPQLDKWLSQAFRRHPSFGKRDRLVYADALFSVVRYSPTALVLEKALTAGADAARCIDLWQAFEPQSLQGWRDVLREIAPESLLAWTAVLAGALESAAPPVRQRLESWRRLTAAIPPELSAMLSAGFPPSLAGDLRQRASLSAWDDNARDAFLAHLRTRPPVWLRLNHPGRRAEAIGALRGCGLEIAEYGDALSARGDMDIRSLDIYKSGAIEIQDLASQEIVETLGPQSGEFVWDACAGGGGKTVAIAARLHNRGAVYASDSRDYKLESLRTRAHRAELNNVRWFAADATTAQQWPKVIGGRGGFDRVLVDVPCSGSGTWRRNPDSRWHTDRRAVGELTALQGKLIDACAASVKPGGTLVYATCSWLPRENEDIVARFAADHPGWIVQRQEILGSPASDADTMFAAVLRRPAQG